MTSPMIAVRPVDRRTHTIASRQAPRRDLRERPQKKLEVGTRRKASQSCIKASHRKMLPPSWQSYAYLLSNIWTQFFSLNSYPRLGTPESLAVDYADPMIGNGGDSPNGSGGMIPSVAPPFGMTRWVAQTRRNYVSMTPYNVTDDSIAGFQGTHQPAIWMGESGTVTVVPGVGAVKPEFEDRKLKFDRSDEHSGAALYTVTMDDAQEGQIKAEMTATSRVGHLRFSFSPDTTPFILLEATRPSVLGSADPTNLTYPRGEAHVDPSAREIFGFNPERQDFIIGPNPAANFAGYFVARFDRDMSAWGTAQNGTLHPHAIDVKGGCVSAYAQFPKGTKQVQVRVGVSFISIDQARRNLENEIPDGQPFEATAFATRKAWKEKLELIKVEGATKENLTTFYTAFYHSLQYPYEQHEDGKYYSGYDEKVHEGESYTGYSIWDTFRAEWAWEILFVPERIPSMVTSMLQDYKEGGWLPMWKNIVESNIMIGTHADVLIAEALLKGFGDKFNATLAYEAVRKDATVPPDGDSHISYEDRQENVGYEVRAGLSSVYDTFGWVADDIHSESASRTLDYAYDDYAAGELARALNHTEDAVFFTSRSLSSYHSIFNSRTGFMEARNASGAWAGEDRGWTEGDKWCYTFDVMHDVPGLIDLVGGKEKFVDFLDRHFDEGHNDHTNEPSHHIPYLYSLAGAASRAQERVRSIAESDYNSTARGLSGNEDCGQMSAWYLFSALGFYPVNPLSLEYVVLSPFFDKVTIHLPNAARPLVINAPGASTRGAKYVAGLTVDGVSVDPAHPVLMHEQIAKGANVEFRMSKERTGWASETVWEGSGAHSGKTTAVSQAQGRNAEPRERREL